jgi:hypothetical protein
VAYSQTAIDTLTADAAGATLASKLAEQVEQDLFADPEGVPQLGGGGWCVISC